MKLQQTKATVLFLGLAAVTLTAGEEPVEAKGVIDTKGVIVEPPGFDMARRPISNPTLFDLAIPQTQLRALFMHHRFPNKVKLKDGTKADLDGDLNLFALQAEYAFNDRLSIVAMRDGYIDFNPDDTFSSDEGFANISAGLKYAFILNPVSQYAMSGSAVIEFPSGNRDVLQGHGDGNINLSLQNVKLWDDLQFASSFGVQVPFDDDYSTISWVSAHLSYDVCRWFIPLVELNWIHVLDEGNGLDLPFEGADLINWGATDGEDNEYVTLALGFRSRLTECVDLGVAYEFPLTDEEDNITDDRFTVDLVWTF